jgi:hypothetical protein
MHDVIEWAASILETDEEILVPSKNCGCSTPPRRRASRSTILRARSKPTRVLSLWKAPIRPRALEDWTEEERAEHIAEMESLGFFGGPRVKLASREITREHIARMIAKHTNNMLNALWSAYDVRPEDLDPEQDAELLDLIAQAKELQLTLQEMLPPPDDAPDTSTT